MAERLDGKIIGKLSFYRTDTLGEGSFGTVYQGKFQEPLETAVDVAIKRILKQKFNRFEAEIFLRIGKHPNIVRFYHVEEDDDFIYIAIELCAATMKDLIEGKYKEPTLNPKLCLRDIVQGVQHLHKHGIVHRDIKLENILISNPVEKMDGRPAMKLTDFGLCRFVKNERGELSGLTKCGTPGWMAPEMCFNDHQPEMQKVPKASFGVDIFSLGVLFCVTLSVDNQHPFGERNLRDYRIKNKEPMILTIEDLKGNLLLFKLIESMLNPEPKKRPTAAQVLQHPFFKELLDFCDIEWSTLTDGNDAIISNLNQLVIDNESDINQRDANGRTPLMLLCMKNKTDSLSKAVETLIRRENVEINAKDDKGNNALTLLCEHYNRDNLIDIVTLLIQRGIDVNSTNEKGLNALMLLCIQYNHENLISIIDVLVERGININPINNNGDNALNLLVQYYNRENLTEIVVFLIHNGIAVNSFDKNGWSALHTVCRYYSGDNLIGIIRLLIENGIDVNAKTDDNWNALMA